MARLWKEEVPLPDICLLFFPPFEGAEKKRSRERN
jgi:hypothetical protein